MKVCISLNVNGLRSAIRKGLISFFRDCSPDFIALQEVKINDDEVILKEDFFRDYHIYSNYAERKGYSGVVTFSKERPINAQTKFSIDLFDKEGRLVVLEMQEFFLVNVYFPSGTMGEHRQKVKDYFLDLFTGWLKSVRWTKPYLILGDFNIAHQEIDIHNPKGLSKTSGFLPHERKWFSEFLGDRHVDLFRRFYPSLQQYSWFSYRSQSKNKNKGWRIDYAICNHSFFNFVKEIKILDEDFSDHLPLICNLDL